MKNIKLLKTEIRGILAWFRSTHRAERCPFWGYNERSARTCRLCHDLFPEMDHVLPIEGNHGDSKWCPCEWLPADIVKARVLELLRVKEVKNA